MQFVSAEPWSYIDYDPHEHYAQKLRKKIAVSRAYCGPSRHDGECERTGVYTHPIRRLICMDYSVYRTRICDDQHREMRHASGEYARGRLRQTAPLLFHFFIYSEYTKRK